MKRLLALLMAMAMIFAFSACGDDAEEKSSKQTEEEKIEAVATYAEKNEKEIAGVFDGSLVEKYSDILVEGNGTVIIAELRINAYLSGADGVFEKFFEMKEAEIEEMLAEMQKEEPAISALELRVFDKDGNLIAEKTIVTDGVFEESDKAEITPDDEKISETRSDEEAVAELAEIMEEQYQSAEKSDIYDPVVLHRGTAIVYAYAYKQPMSEEMIDATTKTLEEAIEENAEIFQNDLKALQEAVPAVSALIVEYYDNTGGLMLSKTFK